MTDNHPYHSKGSSVSENSARPDGVTVREFHPYAREVASYRVDYGDPAAALIVGPVPGGTWRVWQTDRASRTLALRDDRDAALDVARAIAATRRARLYGSAR